jgi:peptidoglycan hydrolase-like protein with peptidoglycan-binding domain
VSRLVARIARLRPGRRLIAVLGLAALVSVGAVVAADPFSTPTAASAGVADNDTPTTTVTVARQSLSSQAQVTATLGYANPSTVVVPAGTAASAVLQAEQALGTAQASLQTARDTLAADERALERAQATLKADRAKEAADCGGDNAAEQASSGSANASPGPCATDHQTVGTDEQAASTAADKVDGDKRAVVAAEAGVAGPAESLAATRSSATSYNETSTFTTLPEVGQIVRRGEGLYSIDGDPVLLLYGSVVAWRAFIAGMSPGPDVVELNANLRALGYDAPTGDAFSAATQAAVRRLQEAHGLDATGELQLGSVIFKPGAVRVTSLQPPLGAAVQPGLVLNVTSTARQVTIALDAAQQAAVKVGDRAIITLPDNRTTPGVVSSVGSVATTPSSDGNNGESQTPTVEVDVTPSDPAATGRLDQAPVSVSITTASVENALVVPVNALLALAGGGYAVEVVDASGARQLVAVTLGLFDDDEGLVEVTDTTLKAGQKIVVPAT